MRNDVQSSPARSWWRYGSARGWMLAVSALLVLGSTMPVSAHGHPQSGTLVRTATLSTPWQNPDWARFVASQCEDVADGVTEAFVNAVPYRGHDATVRIDGSLEGGAQDRRLVIWVGFANCMDTGGYSLPFAIMGEAYFGRPVSFRIPSTAHEIIVQNAGAALGVEYSLTITH